LKFGASGERDGVAGDGNVARFEIRSGAADVDEAAVVDLVGVDNDAAAVVIFRSCGN